MIKLYNDQQAIEASCQRFNKGSAGCASQIAEANRAKASYSASTDLIRGVGMQRDKRRYADLFKNDFYRVNEALQGKDPVTVQKEAFAIEVSKAKNTRPEDEYTWISHGIDLGWLGEYQGWGRSIKGLPKSENFATKVPKEANANGKLPVISEITDYKTAKIDFSSLKLEISKQNKHLENTNEYNIALSSGERKSIITTNLDSLKGYAGLGQKVGKNDVGSPGSKERVNFNKIIGNYIDPVTGESIPTSMGIIHYSKKGYNIVPARPKLEEK